MKKAQAALEYLMTYGWAILIIAIVAAALYYMNVFGGACSPSATGFPPSGGVTILTGEFLVTGTTGVAEIVLRNNAGQTVTVGNVIHTCVSGCTGGPYTEAAVGQITSGSTATITPTLGTGTAGSCYRYSISIEYTTPSLTTTQTAAGSIQGAYQ